MTVQAQPNTLLRFVSLATRTLANALINGNRGTQAPYAGDGKSLSAPAVAMLANKGPKILASAPAASLKICVVPQAGDWTHVSAQSRMLPAFSLEATSGGWVAAPYCTDPVPNIPSIILPQAQWNSPVGEIDIPGLASLTQGMPAQGMAYPDVMGENEQFVTSTGIL
jgi:hypothetical protein